jgi:hypothetical protein
VAEPSHPPLHADRLLDASYPTTGKKTTKPPSHCSQRLEWKSRTRLSIDAPYACVDNARLVDIGIAARLTLPRSHLTAGPILGDHRVADDQYYSHQSCFQHRFAHRIGWQCVAASMSLTRTFLRC